MTEPWGLRWGRGLCGLLLAAWLGALAHYSVLVTPVLFQRFPDQAGDLVAALFPNYFRFGVVLTGAAVLAAYWAWSAGAWVRTRRDGWRLIWTLAAFAAVATNALVLQPMVHTAPAAAFGRLHGLSMLANMLSGLAALIGAWISLLPNRASGVR